MVEADDLGTYVAKFRGAGQGPKALIAEVIAGELGRRLGLRVPDLVVLDIDPVIGRAEPDQEVQDLLKASGGQNLGVDFLPGALGYDPAAHPVDAELASRVLWFDAYVENVDRSWRNPNLLMWHHQLWLIDHGATLTFITTGPGRRLRWRAPMTRPITSCGGTRPTWPAPTRHWPPLVADLLDEARLRVLDPEVDVAAVHTALESWERTCSAQRDSTQAGPAGLSLGERFRWLTAPRSTIIQAGPVHTGLTDDPGADLDHLMRRLCSRQSSCCPGGGRRPPAGSRRG